MKALKTFGILLACFFLVLIFFAQILAIIGVSRSTVPELEKATWLIPAWIVMIALIALPLILYKWWKGKEGFPLVMMVMSILGAILALVIALTLQAALPLQVSGTNISATGEQGLDAIKLITRHYSPMVIGIVVAIIACITHLQARGQRVSAEERSYTDQFVDEDFAPAHEERKGGKKLSKRQRKALREQEESGM